ncbi:MAG: FkbM family methyltransferase [Saprospiraceae bacterium]|nr:FkbM family methyltransferase [Saprospiraceae bacterium]
MYFLIPVLQAKMPNSELDTLLQKVESLAQTSAWGRLIYSPYRYFFAQFIHKVYFKWTRKGILTSAKTFFKHPLSMLLPAGTDIYLTGGKTHDSEIRLAKFLIKTFSNSSSRHFVDVGAHIGYFSALVSILLGEKGQVIAIEAARGTAALLEKNLKNLVNVVTIHAAATERDGESIVFYEFPALYSEYNSTHIEQFQKEVWFQKFKPQKVTVNGMTVDSFVEKFDLKNPVVKIDAEGAEAQVVAGLRKTMAGQSPIIIIEYLRDNNEGHKKAFDMLIEAGYKPYMIDNQGLLKSIVDVQLYFTAHDIDSDNFAFLKADVQVTD